MKLVAKMFKAIHDKESKKATERRPKSWWGNTFSMKLREAAKKVEDGIEKTLTYCEFTCYTGHASIPTKLLNV